MSLDLMKEVKENAHQAQQQPVEETYGGKPALNFAHSLSSLAKHNPSLTEDHIKDHIDTMIMAGHDTTATTIANLLLMLAMHSEVQEMVYQEVMSVCPDKSKPVLHLQCNGLLNKRNSLLLGGGFFSPALQNPACPAFVFSFGPNAS